MNVENQIKSSQDLKPVLISISFSLSLTQTVSFNYPSLESISMFFQKTYTWKKYGSVIGRFLSKISFGIFSIVPRTLLLKLWHFEHDQTLILVLACSVEPLDCVTDDSLVGSQNSVDHTQFNFSQSSAYKLKWFMWLVF